MSVQSVLLTRVIRLAASCIGLVSSAVLLYILSRLPVSKKKQLLARQLWHLALADGFRTLVYAVFDSYIMLPHDFKMAHLDVGSHMCIIDRIGDVGRHTAYLVEIHIALAFGLALFRINASPRLSPTLKLVWPAGSCLCVVELLLEEPHGRKTMGKGTMCYYPAQHHQQDSGLYFMDCCLIISFSLCVLVYSLGVCRTCGITVAGQRRASKRALSFLLANIVTLVPNVFRTITNSESVWEYDVAGALWKLHSFANLLTYVVLLRHQMRKWLLSGRADNDKTLFDVQIGGSEVLSVPSDCSEARARAEKHLELLTSSGKQQEEIDDLLDFFDPETVQEEGEDISNLSRSDNCPCDSNHRFPPA